MTHVDIAPCDVSAPSPSLRDDFQRYRRHGRFDWTEPSLLVVVEYRFGQWCRRQRGNVRTLMSMLHAPVHALIGLMTGIVLPRTSRIGGGLRIFHFGCIFVSPNVVIGRNCTLRHGVTIGTRRGDHDVPTLGDDVEIGAGAKILGNIRIGNRVVIGANAVVLQDVPDDSIAVGVPARIRPRKAARSHALQATR
jgi:serine O-acetyltransferase